MLARQSTWRRRPWSYRILAAPLIPLCDDDSGQAVVDPLDQLTFTLKDLFAYAAIGFPQKGFLAFQDRGAFCQYLGMVEQPAGEGKAIRLLLPKHAVHLHVNAREFRFRKIGAVPDRQRRWIRIPTEDFSDVRISCEPSAQCCGGSYPVFTQYLAERQLLEVWRIAMCVCSKRSLRTIIVASTKRFRAKQITHALIVVWISSQY